MLISLKCLKRKTLLAFICSDVVFIMLINVKMPTIVSILTFMSKINFVLSCLSMKKSFITSGPDLCIITDFYLFSTFIYSLTGYACVCVTERACVCVLARTRVCGCVNKESS